MQLLTGLWACLAAWSNSLLRMLERNQFKYLHDSSVHLIVVVSQPAGIASSTDTESFLPHPESTRGIKYVKRFLLKKPKTAATVITLSPANRRMLLAVGEVADDSTEGTSAVEKPLTHPRTSVAGHDGEDTWCAFTILKNTK